MPAQVERPAQASNVVGESKNDLLFTRPASNQRLLQTPTIDPVTRIIAQERGRRLDGGLFATPAPSIQIADTGGFQWGDAGIGVAVGFGLALAVAGVLLITRHRIPRVRKTGVAATG